MVMIVADERPFDSGKLEDRNVGAQPGDLTMSA
jgi:hypothetical protein